MATLRHTRYQAAVIRDGGVLLLQCEWRDGRIAWMLPGGGREDHESEIDCVVREVREESGLTVRVERMLSDVAADPPDGTYVRWRTYQCTVLAGEATPGGGEGPTAELTAVHWLSLDASDWAPDIVDDPYLYPQLLALRNIFAAHTPGSARLPSNEG